MYMQTELCLAQFTVRGGILWRTEVRDELSSTHRGRGLRVQLHPRLIRPVSQREQRDWKFWRCTVYTMGREVYSAYHQKTSILHQWRESYRHRHYRYAASLCIRGES